MERKKKNFVNSIWHKMSTLFEDDNDLEMIEECYHIDLGENYKIDKSSKVYKITRKSDKKVFAMKIFEKLKEDEQIKEIEVARMIDNPFITKVIEVIPLEDKKGMVMELANMGSF